MNKQKQPSLPDRLRAVGAALYALMTDNQAERVVATASAGVLHVYAYDGDGDQLAAVDLVEMAGVIGRVGDIPVTVAAPLLDHLDAVRAEADRFVERVVDRIEVDMLAIVSRTAVETRPADGDRIEPRRAPEYAVEVAAYAGRDRQAAAVATTFEQAAVSLLYALDGSTEPPF